MASMAKSTVGQLNKRFRWLSKQSKDLLASLLRFLAGYRKKPYQRVEVVQVVRFLLMDMALTSGTNSLRLASFSLLGRSSRILVLCARLYRSKGIRRSGWRQWRHIWP